MNVSPVSGERFYALPPQAARAPSAALPPPTKPFVEPHWFDTQAEAFEDADQHVGERYFWSREEPVRGRRQFASSSSVRSFWEYYKSVPPSERHCYELLREGRPCHLYLDLEFSHATNTRVAGNELVTVLLAAVKSSVCKRLGLQVHEVVELDSTTEKKFSRHIILRLGNNAAWASNHAAGLFLQTVWQEDITGPCRDTLLVRKPDDDGLTPFYDTAVYSRNRAFRLYLSSKAFRTARLLPTAACWFSIRGAPPRSNEELVDVPHWWLFQASLACNVPRDALLLGDACPEKPPTLRREPAARACVVQHASCDLRFPKTIAAACRWAASRDGSAPYVRTCQVHDSRGLLLLGLSGTRFCGNVQRQHRSNGVYIVVDAREGCFYQKCHDPDCRGYRSPPELLKEEALKELCSMQDEATARQSEAFDEWLLGLSAQELAALDAPGVV